MWILCLLKRENEPFSGCWELPGGFAEYGENVELTAFKEAEEETGLKIDIEGLVCIYSEPNRDPRGHIASVCLKLRD